MNKLDRPGASYHSSTLSLLAHQIHPNPLPVTLPIVSFAADDYARAEPGIKGVIDLVKWELWKWDEGVSSRHVLPPDADSLHNMALFGSSHPIASHLLTARTTIIENLSMFSDELMEDLLSLPPTPSAYLTVHPSKLLPHLRAATLRSDILPVFCGSAISHIGTELLMDYAGELLASPLDIDHETQKDRKAVRLLAWKVAWDKRKGWMTFVRVYSGKSFHVTWLS